jgi:hypothetical protein
MGTATSRLALGLAALAIGCAGCGGSGSNSSSSTASPPAPAASAGGAFAWLRPQPAPSSWHVVRIPSGAEMAYPPGWRQIKGDPGTATAALLTAGGSYLGYLNATPQQGGETLANWRTFRVEHNHEEGDRSVVPLAHAEGLRFLDGHASCVKDAYVSVTGAHYTEIACLVAGANGNTVIVGAAPTTRWADVSSSIQRAISGFRT